MTCACLDDPCVSLMLSLPRFRTDRMRSRLSMDLSCRVTFALLRGESYSFFYFLEIPSVCSGDYRIFSTFGMFRSQFGVFRSHSMCSGARSVCFGGHSVPD